MGRRIMFKIQSRLARAAILSGLALVLCSCRQQTQVSAVALPVRHIAQETLLCVPTDAAMIMAFYGDQQAPRKLKLLAEGKSADGPFDDFSITLYKDMVSGAGRLGYDWRTLDLADDDAGYLSGMAMIQGELDKGHPVIVDLTIPSGHSVVIAGYDLGRSEYLVVDPAQPAPGTFPISFDQFKPIWNEHAYGLKIRSLILTSPKTEGTRES
jgi:hypothetical protein